MPSLEEMKCQYLNQVLDRIDKSVLSPDTKKQMRDAITQVELESIEARIDDWENSDAKK